MPKLGPYTKEVIVGGKRKREAELPRQDVWGYCLLTGLGQELGEAGGEPIPDSLCIKPLSGQCKLIG